MFKRARKWHIPPRRVVLWHTFAALPLASLVLLGAFLSYQYHEQSIATRVGVDRAYDLLTSVTALFAEVEEAEVAELTYLITGNDMALAPFLGALNRAGPSATRSAALASDDSEQSKRIASLEDGIAAKLQSIGKTVELRRAKGLDAARVQMTLERPGEATNLLRIQAAEIVRAEYQLLQQRREYSLAHERNFLRIGIAMAGLSIATRLLLALALRWMSKHGRKSPFES
jgi:CHASE3 domain sensor protein